MGDTSIVYNEKFGINTFKKEICFTARHILQICKNI